MTEITAVVYVDDDPLLSLLVSGWAARCNLAWLGQARRLEDAVEKCAGASGRLVLLSTETAGMRWKEVAVQLAVLEPRPMVLLFARRFSDAFLYCSRRAPVDGVVSRGTESERDFREAVTALRAGRKWHCPDFEEAVTAFEKSPHAFFKLLSARELVLLRHFGLGLPDRVIAEKQNLAPSTIQTHRKHVMRKLGLHSARDLVCWALSRGVVSASDFPAEAEQVLSA